MIQKTRYYTEAKAKRAQGFQERLALKLHKSTANRTQKEEYYKKEIAGIEGAIIVINCATCRKPIQVNYKDWNLGKHRKVCYVCTSEKTNKEIKEMYQNIIPVVLKGYKITYHGKDEIRIVKES